MEFKGVERAPLSSRIQDPGSVRIQMMVRGIDEVTAAMARAGAAIVSDHGQKATLPPNLWGVMTAGPDNLFLSMLEPCPGALRPGSADAATRRQVGPPSRPPAEPPHRAYLPDSF